MMMDSCAGEAASTTAGQETGAMWVGHAGWACFKACAKGHSFVELEDFDLDEFGKG